MGILNENLNLKDLDKKYFVVYEPRNTAHHQLSLCSESETSRIGREISVSKAYKIAKKNGWCFNCKDSHIKNLYLICENLNRRLGILTEDMDAYLVVSREENIELPIDESMTEHQKYIRSQVNRLNGYDKTPGKFGLFANFEEFRESIEKNYSRIR